MNPSGIVTMPGWLKGTGEFSFGRPQTAAKVPPLRRIQARELIMPTSRREGFRFRIRRRRVVKTVRLHSAPITSSLTTSAGDTAHAALFRALILKLSAPALRVPLKVGSMVTPTARITSPLILSDDHFANVRIVRYNADRRNTGADLATHRGGGPSASNCSTPAKARTWASWFLANCDALFVRRLQSTWRGARLCGDT